MTLIELTSNTTKERWYQRTRFLIFLNVIGFAFACSTLPFAYLLNNGTLFLISIPLAAGANGGILGFTLWASSTRFPQFRALLISILWGVTPCIIALHPFALCCFPFLAFILTMVLIKSWSQARNLLEAVLVTISSMVLLGSISTLLVNDNIALGIVLVAGVLIYSVTLPRFLKREQQQQIQQHKLSPNYLPDGKYIIGDDGELIPVDDAQNSHKAQS